MSNKTVGIIEVMPENGSKEAFDEALKKKELLDAITYGDYSGEMCKEIINEAVKEVLNIND